jgi:hypothetical protein
VENGIGTRLPDDYKQIAERYGSGQFDGFIHVYEPVSAFLTVDLAFQLRQQEEILRYLRDAAREVLPYPPGRLQAVAGTDNGDTLYWVREPRDDPDAWTITGNAARNQEWPHFDGGLAEFLVAVLSREVSFEIFPDDFPGHRSLTFEPSPPAGDRMIAGLRAQGLYRD